MTHSRQEITLEEYECRASRIIKNLNRILQSKKIMAIELYDDIFKLSRKERFARLLHKKISIFFKSVRKNYLFSILKCKKNLCNEYLNCFYFYSLLMNSVFELFGPLEESVKIFKKKDESKKTLMSKLLKNFEYKILKVINFKEICSEMFEKEIKNIFCKKFTNKPKKMITKFDHFMLEINKIEVKHVNVKYEFKNNIVDLLSFIEKEETLLIKLLRTIAHLNLYKEYYEIDTLKSLTQKIRNECKNQESFESFTKTCKNIYESIFTLVGRVFLRYSFYKIMIIIDQELILNYKEIISVCILQEIYEQFYFVKLNKMHKPALNYIHDLEGIPSFMVILGDALLKFILHLEEKDILESFDNYITLMNVFDKHKIDSLEKVILNGFVYKINKLEEIQKRFVIYIHEVLLKKRHDFFINKKNEKDELNYKDIEIFHVFFNGLKDKESFYHFYLIYLEKRLLSGELIFEAEMLKEIQKQDTNYSFLRRAENMIEEIQSSKLNQLRIQNIFTRNVNNSMIIEPLILSKNNWKIKKEYNLNLLSFKEKLKEIGNQNGIDFHVENSFCLVQLNERIIQMTLLHYLILINYPLKLEKDLYKEIKESLSNITEETYILEIQEKKQKVFQEKDKFMILKAKIIKLLKRKKYITFIELEKEFLDYNELLEKVLNECVNQKYIRKEAEGYYYIP